jgi:subtilase family serine protease
MPGGSNRSAQTAHAYAVVTPTPSPAPNLVSGLLSPVITLATNLLPVCGIIDLSHAECGAIRNLSVTGILGGLLGSIPGYHPADLQRAYNLPSSTAGYGQTIGIVVAYDDPRAESDLGVYRSKFNLGACTSSNGCFTKIGSSGSLPSADYGWAQEAAVDLDMASAICPHCKLLLVEAPSSSVSDLIGAISTAASHGATVISNSYTALEQSGFSAYDSQLQQARVPIVAGAGDLGFGVGWPASSPYVIAVGGTTLKSSLLSSRGYTETVWGASGSGCSSFEQKPSWQTDSGCANRTVADVAAVADPNTGVAVYDSYLSSGGGWLEFGGTSVSTPIVAAAYALAGNAASVSGASSIYQHPQALFDITSGHNGSCSPSYLCNAVRGYDGPSGLGSPNGVGAF